MSRSRNALGSSDIFLLQFIGILIIQEWFATLYLMRIVIDGRIINSSTGRYVERLATYLQDLDTENEYIVLVPTKDLEYWKPTASNFSVQACDYAN